MLQRQNCRNKAPHSSFIKNSDLLITGERFVPGSPCCMLDAHEHYARYAFVSYFVKGAKVLDAGCGCGYGSFMLANADAEEILGVDIDQNAIKFAKSSYSRANLKFSVEDILSTTMEDNSFDLIIAFEAIEHLKESEKFLKEANRLLRNDGVLITSTPNKSFFGIAGMKNWSSSRYHVKEYTAGEFYQLLSSHFKHISIFGQNHIKLPNNMAMANNTDNEVFIFATEIFDVGINGNFAHRGDVSSALSADESQFIIAIASDAGLKWPFEKTTPVCTINREEILFENLRYLFLNKESHIKNLQGYIKNLEKHIKNLERHTENLEGIVKDREARLETMEKHLKGRIGKTRILQLIQKFFVLLIFIS